MSAADMYYEYEVRGGMSVKTESAIFFGGFRLLFFSFQGRRFQIRRSCASNVQYVFSGAKMCRKNFKKLSNFY